MTTMTKSPVARGVALVVALALVVFFFAQILKFLAGSLELLLVLGVLGSVIGVPIWLFTRMTAGHRADAAAAVVTAERAAIVATEERARQAAIPHFDIGLASGIFRKLGGEQTPELEDTVKMDLPSAQRGLVALGPPGSGKTSGIMNPMLAQSIAMGHSALILAIKGEVPGDVRKIARQFGRENDVLVISPGALRLNPLGADGGGLTPESAAAGIADGLGDPKDPYWRDAPAALAQGHLELLAGIGARSVTFQAVGKKDAQGNVVIISPARTVQLSYSFDSLRETIMLDGADLRTLLALGAEVLASIAEDPAESARAALLEDALTYFARDYTATFERASNGPQMLAGLRSALLAPLKALAGLRAIRETFCGASDVHLETALNNGKIVVVAVDDTQYPTAFPAVLRLVFRIFDGISQRRGVTPGVSPCMLWMDEYASFASQEHVRTLSRSRSAGIIPVLGFQSISFLSNEMKSPEAARAIVAVCASVVVCGATDDDTAKMIQQRVGDGRWIETRESSVSQSRNNAPGAILAGLASGGHRGAFAALVSNQNGSISQTTTHEARQENLAAPSRLSQLGPQKAPDGTPYVLAIAAIAQSDGGELRDMLLLPQLDYLRPGRA